MGTEICRTRSTMGSHADPCNDINELAEINRQKVYEIEQIIKTICGPQQPSGVRENLGCVPIPAFLHLGAEYVVYICAV